MFCSDGVEKCGAVYFESWVRWTPHLRDLIGLQHLLHHRREVVLLPVAGGYQLGKPLDWSSKATSAPRSSAAPPPVEGKDGHVTLASITQGLAELCFLLSQHDGSCLA